MFGRKVGLHLALLCLVCSSAFGSFRFVVVGDSRGSDNGINLAILTGMANAVVAESPAFVLFPGDLVSNGTETQLRSWVEAFATPLSAAGIAVFPCRGNHDASITAWNAVFSGALTLPGNGPPGEVNLTYSFTHENALFIALDEVVPAHSYAVNQEWLEEQLAQNLLPHVFVFGHYPAFAVSHVDCLASHPAERDLFWDSLAQAGARVYFAGHDHFYDHARISASAEVGLEQYVVGSGGAPLYTWNQTYANPRVQAVAHEDNFGYVVVEVSGPDVSMTFKQRAEADVFVAADTMAYSIPPSPTALPAMSIRFVFVGILAVAAAGACAIVYGLHTRKISGPAV